MSRRDDRRDPVAGATQNKPRDEPFLSRWARLKQQSREPPAAQAGAPPAPREEQPPGAEAGEHETATAAEAGSESREPAGLPPLDSLTEDSDFGPFMRTGVDPELRRAALRKMFRNPRYAVVDELDPFRADFAAFTALGDIVTADMKFHAERLLRAQLEQAAEAAEDAGTAPGEAGPATAADAAATDAAAPADAGVAAQDGSATPAEKSDEQRDV